MSRGDSSGLAVAHGKAPPLTTTIEANLLPRKEYK